MNLPKEGDKLYLPTQMYISRGDDDIQGGIAEIDRIEISKKLPIEHYNSIMVGFKEIGEGRSWNYRYLLENQEEWSQKYAGKTAKPDPDINTPWIQEGDIVNEEVYKGKDIW
jgi:hypothetical protein